MHALRRTSRAEYRASVARRARRRALRRAFLNRGVALSLMLAAPLALSPSLPGQEQGPDRPPASDRNASPAARLTLVPSLITLATAAGPAYAYAQRHPFAEAGPRLERAAFETIEDAWSAAFFGDRQRMAAFIEHAAVINGLPVDFLMRLLRQESGLNPQAISRAGAMGVAQFMPGTASERGLLDPFNPYEAIPKSAELLKEHRGRFGNLGLAAAAYNAGPQRVRDWLAGRSPLPKETRDYVAHITGRTIEDWQQGGDLFASAESYAAHALR
ncbi:lytic transglycosylase domain-containing protein [Methylobacterium durans]|uniref:Lytic transglycosylase domain-containing protein n=2 Tax=Methylobacterium durans TaxID=2202825 RepID=A0A2U8W872_9HYPH|nr:lytic transglycosylase domain-containing protein [Methylobacterium durans]